SLALRSLFREGLVAWVDGVEIARRYVAPGAPPEAPALQIHGAEPESFVAPARLAAGEHVLALEIHGHKPGLGPLVEANLAGFDNVRIVRGPYLLRPSATELTVAWDTDLDAPGEVRYGGDAGYGRAERSALPVRHHALRLRGLHPGRTYHYSVIAGGTDSGDATFHTLPAGEEPLRFVTYGDVRSGHEIHARLVEQVIKEDPDFVLTLGDLVDRGSEEAEWQQFFQIAAPLLRVLPIVPALGNHQVYPAPEGLAGSTSCRRRRAPPSPVIMPSTPPAFISRFWTRMRCARRASSPGASRISRAPATLAPFSWPCTTGRGRWDFTAATPTPCAPM